MEYDRIVLALGASNVTAAYGKGGLAKRVQVALGTKALVWKRSSTSQMGHALRLSTLCSTHAYILIKMDRMRASALEGLEPGVIPIEPETKAFQLTRGAEKHPVQRRQLPIIGAYALADYRPQGKTNIAGPPRVILQAHPREVDDVHLVVCAISQLQKEQHLDFTGI